MRAPLLLLLALVALPCAAQPYRGNLSPNEQLVRRALDDMGADYAQREVRDAVADAFDELYPEYRWSSYRLSETQAHAVAFTALGMLDYTFTADPPYSRPRPTLVPRPTGNNGGYGSRCANAQQRLYDLALYLPPNEFRLFLTSEQRDRVRAELSAIGREASACGCRPLSEGALNALRQMEGTSMPELADTVARIDALRNLADQCR